MPTDKATIEVSRSKRASATAALSVNKVTVTPLGSNNDLLKTDSNEKGDERPKPRYSDGSLLAAVMQVSSSSNKNVRGPKRSATSASSATDETVKAEQRPSDVREQLRVSDISDMLREMDLSTSLRKSSTRPSQRGSISPSPGRGKPVMNLKFDHGISEGGHAIIANSGEDIAADIAIAVAANLTMNRQRKVSTSISLHGGSSTNNCSKKVLTKPTALVRKTKSMGDRTGSTAVPVLFNPAKQGNIWHCKNPIAGTFQETKTSCHAREGLEDSLDKRRRTKREVRRAGRSESKRNREGNRESLKTSREKNAVQNSPGSPSARKDAGDISAPSPAGISQSAREPRSRPRRGGSLEARTNSRTLLSRGESVGILNNTSSSRAGVLSIEARGRPLRTGSVQTPRTLGAQSRTGTVTTIARTRSASLSVMTRGRGVSRTRLASISQRKGARTTSLSPMTKRSPSKRSPMTSSMKDCAHEGFIGPSPDALKSSECREPVQADTETAAQTSPDSYNRKKISPRSRPHSPKRPKGGQSGKSSRSPRRRDGGRRKDTSSVLQNQLQQAVLGSHEGFAVHDYSSGADSDEMKNETDADNENRRHRESLQKTLDDIRFSVNQERQGGEEDKKRKEWTLFPAKSRLVPDLGFGPNKVAEKAFGVAAAVEIARAKVAEVGAAIRRPSLSSQSQSAMDDSSSKRGTCTSERTMILGPQIDYDTEENDESVEFF